MTSTHISRLARLIFNVLQGRSPTRLHVIVMPLEPYDDPNHEWNSSEYHSGKQCVGGEDDLLPARPRCDGKAGTAWSPHWCQSCNAKRIRRITKSLKKLCEPREA